MKELVRGYVLLVAVIVGALTPGCSAPRPERDVRNPNPAGKIPAYKEAVRERNLDATRQMVKDLDSDDPAVRMFAIVGLRRLTGETFGYRYFEDQHQRLPAIRRWERWLGGEDADNQQGAATANGATDAPYEASGP